ncbi:protein STRICTOSIDINE SYNTHASE-LIKE 12-like [Prosopis cineraria]|uniref:protein STRICTOSIDINE SYNTHASE-LIKE 12-like n=1 Tax=Prosopis cineraria TaxID=364024 RepID=UPI00240F4D67|nr:protein STRICTOSIDINE SYNTHASE-LIKE 12-like [Prosopis cineraria]
MTKTCVVGILILQVCWQWMGSGGERVVTRMDLPSPVTGPESLAFDSIGGGPYTGASDGRIFKFENGIFVEFAYTSPVRNKTICDGIAGFSALQQTCGRPLGLGFHNRTQQWYITDAYRGLVTVPSYGGRPTPVVTSVECRPFRFLDALDIDPSTGIVYFTEASSRFQFKDMQALLSSSDTSGSLLSYDPRTGETRVLLRNLALAAGVAVSGDGSFVLVTEFLANRVQRFWLTGPAQNRSELFLQLGGSPDNIKRNSRGDFWIAVNTPLGPPSATTYLPLGVRVNAGGFILQIVPLTPIYGNQEASEVHEFNGALYSGSIVASYATIFSP